MKKKYNYLIGLLFATLFAACSEEEVQPFSDAPGVNFMERTVASNGKVSWGEGYTALSLSVNFVDSFYAKGIYGVEEREIPLRVQLEGLLNDTPLKVKFKVLPVEKEEYDLAEVIVPEEPVEIKAGEYTVDATFIYKRPAVLGKEYRARIAIDYENSDVVAGTKERQYYTLSIQDTFKWDSMYIESKEEWNTYYAPFFGEFGEEKVRFLMYVMKAVIGASFDYACYYTVNGPASYGFQRYVQNIKDVLETYNAEHPDAPAKEADGTLITFP